MTKKHIICYSGGHSSALTAVEVARKYGIENTILLNHDINPNVEDKDIKRYKKEVARYLGAEITYANHPDFNTKDQFDVCIDAGAFQANVGGKMFALCTNRLKTAPFEKYLKTKFPSSLDEPANDCLIYYGFDLNEMHRVQQRASTLALMGYKTDFPLALWCKTDRTIFSTKEIGIEPPLTYSVWKHANCTGCLKAKKLHWYITYCTRQDIWEKAKEAERIIGYSIQPNDYLDELEPLFKKYKNIGLTATEHMNATTFFAMARRKLTAIEAGQLEMLFDDKDMKPCECVF